MGVQQGLKKGSEDFKRKELQQLRKEIMNNRRYGIVGQCSQCHAIVELDHMLDCTNDPKHHKITDINPTIRKTEI